MPSLNGTAWADNTWSEDSWGLDTWGPIGEAITYVYSFVRRIRRQRFSR